MIQYIGEKCAKTHTRGSTDKVQVICPDCGKIRDKLITINNIYNNHSIGCQCGDGYSYGHKYIFSLLIRLNQEYIDNYTFDWCRFYNPFKQKETTGEYDFVLENNKLIIEVDGEFHRKDNTKSGQTKEESKFIDDEKDRLANENGYKMIRISDEGDIKQNILDSDLNELFDLSQINWLKVEEFALSNRVKEACNYKKNNSELTCKDISILMKLDVKTINNYLKKGNLLNWCDYDSKKELEKNNKKLGMYSKEKSKPIKMFNKNMNLIYMFFNASEAEKKSEKLLHNKLLHSMISIVCTGKRKSYKGYIFQYTTKEEYEQWLSEQKELHNQELVQAI